MTAPYAPQTWHDLPATDTPISAARLIVIENGVARYSTVQSSGTNMTARSVLNITGSGVAVSDNSGATPPRTDVTITAGSGGYSAITDGSLTTYPARTELLFNTGFTVSDHSTYTQVDATGGGGSGSANIIAPVRATNAAAGNQMFLSSLLDNPVDGVTIANGDRVYYSHTGTAGDHGVFIVNSTGGWTRAIDMALGTVFNSGVTVKVNEGTVYGGKIISLRESTGAATFTVGNFPTGPILNVSVPSSGPVGYTTISIVSNNTFIIPAPAGVGYFHCDIPDTTGNKVISVKDPTDPTKQTEIYLCIQQNLTQTVSGGWFWELSPSTIAFDTGIAPTTGPGNPSPFDYGPGTITFIKLTWMGSALGYFAQIVGSVPPYYFPLSQLPTSWTMTLSVTGWASVSTQSLVTPIYFMRYVSAAVREWVYNALCHFCSAAMRTRLNNNNYVIEIGARFNADGLRGSTQRGGVEQFGGYSASTSAGAYISGGFLQSQGGNTGHDAIGLISHEMAHGISANYYGGGNPHPGAGIGNGSEPDLISQHSTLVTLQNDCIANGNGSTFSDEWFAEMLRGMRVGDNGTCQPVTGSPAAAVGPNTNAGVGGSGGTPQQRADRFVTYINTLGLV